MNSKLPKPILNDFASLIKLTRESVERAKNHESLKNFKAARNDYFGAAQFMLEACKKSNVPQVKIPYQQKAAEIMNRIEDIDKILKMEGNTASKASKHLENQQILNDVMTKERSSESDAHREIIFPFSSPPSSSSSSLSFSTPSLSSSSSSSSSSSPSITSFTSSLSSLRSISLETPNSEWNDIAGLETAKQMIREAIFPPIQQNGLVLEEKKLWKKILLFGPPNAGKTCLVKAMAFELKCPLHVVSSLELVDEWEEEKEQLTNQLSILSQTQSPLIVFIDGIDIVANGFLLAVETMLSRNSRVIFIGASNAPWNLNPNITFEKLIYIPLPNVEAREAILRKRLTDVSHELKAEGIRSLAQRTEGLSTADLSNLVRDAALASFRAFLNAERFKKVLVPDLNTLGYCYKYMPCDANDPEAVVGVPKESVGSNEIFHTPVSMKDVMECLNRMRPSVPEREERMYEEWVKKRWKENNNNTAK